MKSFQKIQRHTTYAFFFFYFIFECIRIFIKFCFLSFKETSLQIFTLEFFFFFFRSRVFREEGIFFTIGQKRKRKRRKGSDTNYALKEDSTYFRGPLCVYSIVKRKREKKKKKREKRKSKKNLSSLTRTRIELFEKKKYIYFFTYIYIFFSFFGIQSHVCQK